MYARHGQDNSNDFDDRKGCRKLTIVRPHCNRRWLIFVRACVEIQKDILPVE